MYRRWVVDNVLDCNIVVSVSEFQLCYYIHSQTKTIAKGMKLLTHPQLNSTTAIQGGGFWY